MNLRNRKKASIKINLKVNHRINLKLTQPQIAKMKIKI